MFKNLLIKWKLATLVAVMMAALLVVGISGYTGIATVGNAVNEIGVVRLPSIQGLMMMNEGQTAVAVGRDYADVTPSRGVYKGDSESQLAVGVSVRRARAAMAEPEFLRMARPNFAGGRRRPTAVREDMHQQQQQQQQ